jgi:iron complex transport system substrate-binding protein
MKKRLLTLILLALFTLLAVLPTFAQDTAFPITVDHKFGSTTLTEAPQRVVAIGYTEQDLLLAVGVTPVAVRYWYGDETNAIFPWAQDKVEGEMPIVLNMPFGALNYEAILDLEPDLISAVTSGITQEEYDLLSQIAPTIAQSGDYIDFGMPWQEATQLVGDAVGKSAEAAEAVAEVEALFAEARAEHPEFEGKTVAVAYFYESTYGIYTSQDIRGRFFTELGFTVPEELDEIAGDSFYADVSAERIDLLDQDLIAILNLQFIEGGREALEAEPLFSQLTAVQEGRVIYFDEQAENALGFSSPLSLPYALAAALPQLEAIFPPTMTSDSCEAGFRLFDHELLATDPVCVPENPQRIVVLSWAAAEMAIALDLRPVAVYLLPDSISALPALQERVGDTPVLDWQFSLEQILALDPDVILVSYHGDIYDELTAIAPTVHFNWTNSNLWKEEMRFWGNVLGNSEAVEGLLTAYDARIAAFQEVVGERLNTETISVVRVYAEGPTIYMVDSWGGSIVAEVGLRRPESQGNTVEEVYALFNGQTGQVSISNEELRTIDADHVLIWTRSDEEALTARDTLFENPLWQLLDTAEEERVYISTSYWIGDGIFSAHAALDDLFRYVADVDPAEVSPNPFLTDEAEETPEATDTP